MAAATADETAAQHRFDQVSGHLAPHVSLAGIAGVTCGLRWLPKAIELRETGLTTKEIGLQLGVSQATVSIWLPFRLRTLDPHRLRDRRVAAELGMDHRAVTAARYAEQSGLTARVKREAAREQRRAAGERAKLERMAAREARRMAREQAEAERRTASEQRVRARSDRRAAHEQMLLAAKERRLAARRQARTVTRTRLAISNPLSLDRLTLGGFGLSLSEFIADVNAEDPAETAARHELERIIVAQVGTLDLDDLKDLGAEDRARLQRRLIDLGLAADHRTPLSLAEPDSRDVWTRPELSSARVYGHAVWARGAPCGDDGEVLDPDNHWRSLTGSGRGRCICGVLSPVLATHRLRLEWLDSHIAEYAGSGAPDRAYA